jgi:hypothetical protein
MWRNLRMKEKRRIYAVGMMMSRPASDSLGDISVFYQMPGIVIAQSKAEAVAMTFRRATSEYPESEGYSNHQAVVLEMTTEFLELVRQLDPPSPDDPRRGEHEIMGQAAQVEEAIQDEGEAEN